MVTQYIPLVGIVLGNVTWVSRLQGDIHFYPQVGSGNFTILLGLLHGSFSNAILVQSLQYDSQQLALKYDFSFTVEHQMAGKVRY